MTIRQKTFNYSLINFFKHSINGGIILMGMALLAMVIANSPWHILYQEIWSYPISMQLGEFNLFSHHGEPLTLAAFINDGLMAIFFFLVGLEIKREILVGELSSVRRASLPVIVAFGGMICPVLVYFAIAHSHPESIGIAIPMATDIAFTLGILSMLGKRVPIGLKIFLTAFAVVDDIGGILVIAIGYTAHLDLTSLLIGISLLGLLIILNRMGVMKKSLYVLVGIAVWYFFLQSGIHSTIAGVLVAFTIPARPRLDVRKYVDRARESLTLFDEETTSPRISNKQIRILKDMEEYTDKVISPLQYFEDSLHKPVNYFIMPLFAFANAGVHLGGDQGLFGTVTLATALGLFVGKFIGLFSFTWIFTKLRIVSLPHGSNWKSIAGICMLGGVGFTVSLFIANLSFGVHYPELLGEAKLGTLLGTIISGIGGYTILNIVLPKTGIENGQDQTDNDTDDDD
jgi:NhaA family Na+:H+ antiporter